jgi:hypothetical protein
MRHLDRRADACMCDWCLDSGLGKQSCYLGGENPFQLGHKSCAFGHPYLSRAGPRAGTKARRREGSAPAASTTGPNLEPPDAAAMKEAGSASAGTIRMLLSTRPTSARMSRVYGLPG